MEARKYTYRWYEVNVTYCLGKYTFDIAATQEGLPTVVDFCDVLPTSYDALDKASERIDNALSV